MYQHFVSKNHCNYCNNRLIHVSRLKGSLKKSLILFFYKLYFFFTFQHPKTPNDIKIPKNVRSLFLCSVVYFSYFTKNP